MKADNWVPTILIVALLAGTGFCAYRGGGKWITAAIVLFLFAVAVAWEWHEYVKMLHRTREGSDDDRHG